MIFQTSLMKILVQSCDLVSLIGFPTCPSHAINYLPNLEMETKHIYFATGFDWDCAIFCLS